MGEEKGPNVLFVNNQRPRPWVRALLLPKHQGTGPPVFGRKLLDRADRNCCASLQARSSASLLTTRMLFTWATQDAVTGFPLGSTWPACCLYTRVPPTVFPSGRSVRSQPQTKCSLQ